MDSKSFLFIIMISSTLMSCKKDQNQEDFDRKAMLNSVASAVIQPSIAELNNYLIDLHAKSQNFTADVNNTTLQAVRLSFLEAYKSFQRCKMYDFGPMMDQLAKASMNTYPTDIVQINSNISSGVYDINAASNIDAIGFPAVDYLLYPAFSSTTAAVDSFTISTNAANRKSYLIAITEKMKAEIALVNTAWSSYASTFIAADGNDVGSSTSLMFNEFVKDIELLKNAKIGIPSGQQTGGQTLPSYVEGYYSQSSIDLALENVAGLKNAFLGGSGSGFDDYIKDVESEDVSVSLADNISNQFDVVSSSINSIGTPLSDEVDQNPTAVNTSYLEIKKLLTYCKTDMSSALGLLITFQDNDGD